MFKCKHKSCSIPKHEGLGYCKKHYKQFKNHKRTFDFTCMDFNETVDCGDHVELILLDRKMRERGRAKIDKEDLPKVKAVGRWSLDKNGYVTAKQNSILMHRVIIKAKLDEDVDHKNTGVKHRSDNRKSNLRLASNQENQFNQGKRKDNTSGFKGVSYHKRDKTWQAKIKNNNKLIHLGSFNTPEEASEAYVKAAKKLHGDFLHKSLVKVEAPTNIRKTLIRFSRNLI